MPPGRPPLEHRVAVTMATATGALAVFWGIVQLMVPGHVFWRVREHPAVTGVGGASPMSRSGSHPCETG